MSSQEKPQKCGNPNCTNSTTASTPSPPALQKCGRCKKAAYCSRACQASAWPAHKRSCVRPNYIIKFHLAPGHIADPVVTRTLSCPADAVFYHLHLALQVAFGWATTHSFDFAVANPNFVSPFEGSTSASPNFSALLEHMKRMDPNRAADPSDPQEYLFRVVDPVEQTMFSGIDRVHEGARRHPSSPEKKADDYKLYQLFDDPKYQGKQIIYTYDFGDNWEHHLTITGRADAKREFSCLDGSGHYVAEDVGGTRGWEELKAAYRTARPTKEQRERREWFENTASNRDPAGLGGNRAAEWDREQLNRDLRNFIERFERMADESQENMASMMNGPMAGMLPPRPAGTAGGR